MLFRAVVLGVSLLSVTLMTLGLTSPASAAYRITDDRGGQIGRYLINRGAR